MGDIYFWRQLFILGTIEFYAVSTGLMISFPSVLIPELLSPNSTSDIKTTSDEASWIAASNGFAGILGFIILSPIMQAFGRKVVHIVSNLFLFVGWLILWLAHSTTALYIARIIQGISIGAIYINGMIIGEYSDPKRRGYFISIKSVAISAGALLCHLFTLFWNWRQIAAFGTFLPAIGIIITLFWPETPSYLAMKGHVKKCEETYVWLHGYSKMRELDILLSSQTQKLRNPSKEIWYKFLFRRDFVKPFIIVSVLTLLMDLCGKYYFVVYVIQIMVELIGDNSIAIYCSIGSDLLIVFALIISCVIISHFKRRSMLFVFGVIIVALMLLITLIIALKISCPSWVTPALILILCFLANVGLIPACFALIGEVFPLEHKGAGSCMTGIVFTLLYTLLLKLTPVLMDYAGVKGVYATYGFGIALCLVVLYFIVPETKDKSLQEIENEFNGNEVSECNENLPLSTDNSLTSNKTFRQRHSMNELVTK